MLLAIDIGNTHTVIGIYRKDTLVADWRMASLTHRTADENWLTLKSFCADAGSIRLQSRPSVSRQWFPI